MNKELYDSSASLFVLSSLMRQPLIIEEDEYVLTKTDFGPPLQQIVFTSVFNMAKQGISTITPQDIDVYIKQFPTQYEYYQKMKGYEWILDAYKLTQDSDIKQQFNYYYNRLKKFSMLRDLSNLGFDISEFYDINQDLLQRDKEDEKLNKTKLNEIPNRIREKLNEIENKHIGKDNGSCQIASKGLRKLVEDFQENPEVGLPIDGDYLNYATRGARKGKFYLFSAPSGMGKTRHLVGNACALSLPYIDKDKKVVIKKELKPILFVATEMTADEIQTLILAYVSGVNEEHIILGVYKNDELERIQMALEIIESSKWKNNFIIDAIPDPSIAMIKARLVKFILQENIEYIFYDYIFSSPGLLNEFRDIEVREDVALMMLSNSLKEIAMNYDVFIESATQLNDGWSKQSVRNQNCLRGSKAIGDKIDIGMISVRIDEEELKKVKEILEAMHLNKFPNTVIDMYKNRRGRLSNVKIFRYFDYGTCRTEDLLVTNNQYNIEQVAKILPQQGDIRIVEFDELRARGELNV